MATNNQLRLLISTSLDNAGIKATEEQIKSLEEAISKANKKGKTGL